MIQQTISAVAVAVVLAFLSMASFEESDAFLMPDDIGLGRYKNDIVESLPQWEDPGVSDIYRDTVYDSGRVSESDDVDLISQQLAKRMQPGGFTPIRGKRLGQSADDLMERRKMAELSWLLQQHGIAREETQRRRKAAVPPPPGFSTARG